MALAGIGQGSPHSSGGGVIGGYWGIVAPPLSRGVILEHLPWSRSLLRVDHHVASAVDAPVAQRLLPLRLFFGQEKKP